MILNVSNVDNNLEFDQPALTLSFSFNVFKVHLPALIKSLKKPFTFFFMKEITSLLKMAYM